MAAYKLEDNIREKLEDREIKPSADAWRKLEAKLDAAQPKKKTVAWYYMAASFIGILILASVFLHQDTKVSQDLIVNENLEIPDVETNSEIITKNSEVVKIVSEEGKNEKNTSKANTIENPIKPIPQKKGAVEKKYERNTVIAKISEEEKQVPNSEMKIINSEDSLFNQKIDEVVASVRKLQESNNEVSVSEVEEMLNTARRDLQTQRILKNAKVDATALLQDVEWELEKTFRDKVFDALGEGFRKIRTAVIERND